MTRTACLNAIYELAKQDERVVFIGSDLSPNTMLEFKRDFPKRFFMEGIQEQNIIGMAAGLAMEGFIPYVNTIATFLTRRCYEQVAIDICTHNLPVRLIGNGGGLLYAPLGPTHCAIEDIAIMRVLPNMMVKCCAGNNEMKAFIPETLNHAGPIYIRLGKDSDLDFAPLPPIENLWGRYINILFISTGIMSNRCMEIFKILSLQNIMSQVIHHAQIDPLNMNEILDEFKDPWYNFKLIVTAEEGIINGGLGSAVIESLAKNNIHIPVLRFGIPHAFPHHYGEQEDLLETYGLTPEPMAQRIKEFYDGLPKKSKICVKSCHMEEYIRNLENKNDPL